MKARWPSRAVALRVATIVAAIAIVAGALAVVMAFRSSQVPTAPQRDQAAKSIDSDPAPAPSSAEPRGEPSVPAPVDPAAYQIDRLRALKPITSNPTTSTIPGDAAQQPDLYAAEFVRRLLTQDYRAPRDAHLAWVQAESAQTLEPLVVGLIPTELRDRYALFSVTDATDSPTPVPNEEEWQGLGLQHGYTTVAIDRVEEPLAWTNAVASGRITDPGITGRDVSATVVRHLSIDGKPRITTFSIAISLNLEGPPTRDRWGFVAAISYTAIQVS